jgi:hypothetical protein
VGNRNMKTRCEAVSLQGGHKKKAQEKKEDE